LASPVNWTAGFNLAGTVFDGGPALLELAPSYLSGGVQWVDTIGGSNVNVGDNPELPVQTLAQAVTNSAANGLIVIGQGSAEAPTGSQSVALAGLTIVGCGSGSTRPRYTCAGAVDLFAVSAAGVRIRNLYFPASTAVSTARVAFTAANGEVKGCYFECGASDTNRAVRIHTAANSCRVRDSSFVVTASRPAMGLEISAAVTDTTIEDSVFDGGSYGWTDYALKVSAAATRIFLEGQVELLNRSDAGFTVTATSYQLFGLVPSGGSKVVLTA
jgi:hypothetical protein